MVLSTTFWKFCLSRSSRFWPRRRRLRLRNLPPQTTLRFFPRHEFWCLCAWMAPGFCRLLTKRERTSQHGSFRQNWRRVPRMSLLFCSLFSLVGPNHFCSSSCAATYSNAHKTKGTRRSKLEVWLEAQLPLKYPDLVFHFNRKDAIDGELDIYIPSINLAFELNGIFHYEPIYGKDKLNQIRNNDTRKFQACIEKGIELCIIDTSKQTYFKEQTARKYLDIVTNIIDIKIGWCPISL